MAFADAVYIEWQATIELALTTGTVSEKVFSAKRQYTRTTVLSDLLTK